MQVLIYYNLETFIMFVPFYFTSSKEAVLFNVVFGCDEILWIKKYPSKISIGFDSLFQCDGETGPFNKKVLYGNIAVKWEVLPAPSGGQMAVYKGFYYLTHLGLNKMADILQTTFPKAFSYKLADFEKKFVEMCSLGSNLWISQHWIS